MSIKEDIIELVNIAYRHDNFINDFSGAVSKVFETLIAYCNSIRNNTFFDSLDEEGAQWWEKTLNIFPLEHQTLQDRRSKIQAKYLSKNHNEVELLQRVCDSWKNGETSVDFVNGKIKIEFIGEYGVPSDLDSLKLSVEDIKPAHIPLMFVIKYLLVEDIHEVKTIEQMENLTIEMFTKGKEIL